MTGGSVAAQIVCPDIVVSQDAIQCFLETVGPAFAVIDDA